MADSPQPPPHPRPVEPHGGDQDRASTQSDARQARPTVPEAFVTTPNAERYLLESDSLRRRQLRSALLHGSGRTWRERQRLWPAALAGVLLVAVIVASITVANAFSRQRQIDQEKERKQSASLSVRPPAQAARNGISV
jgi:type II secretory pathway component PulL